MLCDAAHLHVSTLQHALFDFVFNFLMLLFHFSSEGRSYYIIVSHYILTTNATQTYRTVRMVVVRDKEGNPMLAKH